MSEPFQPEILLLYCGNVLADGDHLPEGVKKRSGFKVRFVRMPCSSKIETRYLIKLVEQGTDCIVIVACPGKECQFSVGSSRAEHRIKHARALLEEVGMGAGRVGIIRRSGLSANELMGIAEEQANSVKALGPNPMKVAR